MSLNRMVSFHGGTLASPAPRIRHLGVFTMPQPTIKTEEALPLVGGGGLLTAGLLMKGKPGTILTILGGVTAAIGGGMWLYRMMFGQPTTVVAPIAPPKAPTAPKPTGYQAIVQQLAPVAAPLIKNIFDAIKPSSSQPSSGVPGMVTSL